MHKFMEFAHGFETYEKGKVFTRAELEEITPATVKEYLCYCAYGDPHPNYDHDFPSKCRATTLEQYKKSISYFMPNKGPSWIDGRGGNPTKSDVVHECIRAVRRAEVRGKGATSCVKRAMTEAEFLKVLELLREKPDFNSKYKYPAMALLQGHLIGRVDDVCHLKTSDPKSNPTFAYALSSQVRWSKNVLDERACPDQILLASMDSYTCTILNLALYLEQFLGWYPDSDFLFTEKAGDHAADNLIAQYRGRLDKDVFKTEAFELLATLGQAGGVGTHSFRKLFATKARASGAHTQHVEIRGRWKGNGRRVVNRYIDVTQVYDDAYVASLLCRGGPIAYKIKNGYGFINDEFLFESVCPNIARRYGHDRGMVRVLGTALLYACLEDSLEDLVPLPMKNRVTAAFIPKAMEAGMDDPQQSNPVAKIPLVVYRVNDQLRIDLVEGDGIQALANANADGAAPVMAQGNQEQMNVVLIQLQQMKNNLVLMQSQLEGVLSQQKQWHNGHYVTIKQKINRFGGTIVGAFSRQDRTQQGHRQQVVAEDEENQEGGIAAATLAPHLRTLIDLWHEYYTGIGGRRAAKDWTTREKGRKGWKQKYYRRNCIWQIQERLVRSGMTPNEACAKLRQTYGLGLSVTKIIDRIIEDRQRYRNHQLKCHPNLR